MNQNGLQVIMVSAFDNKIVNQLINNEKAIHFSIPLTRKLTPATDLVALIKLVILLQKLKPEIVHTHTPKAGLIGMIAAWICRIPNRLHTVAGMPLQESKGIQRSILRISEKVTYALATRIYPNSFGLMNFISARRWTKPEKLKMLAHGSSNGIDTNFFQPSEEINFLARSIRSKYNVGSKTVFIFVGRVVKEKGIDELLLAFREVSMQFSCLLFIVGPLEAKSVSKNSMQILSESPDVFHVGFHEDVRPWLAASDIHILPSYREGLPNVLLQAGAMEVPSIASNIIGCNEIITHGINGLLVAPKDVNSLKQSMRRLLDHPELRKQIGLNARINVASRYRQDLVWNGILEEYKIMTHKTDVS